MNMGSRNRWGLLVRASWAPLLVLVGYWPLAPLLDRHLNLPVDLVFHFAAGLAGVYFVERAYAALPGLLGRPEPVALRMIALAAFGIVAVAWEVGEHYADLSFGTDFVGSTSGPVPDLLFGVCGAVCFATWSLWRERFKREPPRPSS